MLVPESNTNAASGDEANRAENTRGRLLYVIMALAGVLYAFVFSYFLPEYIRPRSWEGFPQWIRLCMTFWQRAMTWPWAIGTMILLAAIYRRERRKKRSWILVFAFGGLLGSMLITAIQH